MAAVAGENQLCVTKSAHLRASHIRPTRDLHQGVMGVTRQVCQG